MLDPVVGLIVWTMAVLMFSFGSIRGDRMSEKTPAHYISAGLMMWALSHAIEYGSQI